MDGGKILGILICIALILSVITVGYNTITNKFVEDKNVVKTTEILDESELNQTSSENDSEPLETVTVNINQKVGGAKIRFVDNSTTIYNITSKNKKNNTTTVTSNKTGNHLDVNINSNSSDNTIILSNKYNYTINGELVSGGVSAYMANKAKIDEMNINITAGGLQVNLTDGRLNALNSHITVGGLNILGKPMGVTTITSNIEVGGVNIKSNNTIADIFSNIEVGGINPGKYKHVGENEYKSNLFDSSDNKLIIYNNIKLGGLNSQSF